MRVSWLMGILCALALTAFVTVRAEDKPADAAKPAADTAKPDTSSKVRLTQPWSKISSLTDEQKTKIKEIHAKSLAEQKAIKEKENADIMALLNDEQKTEAKSLMDQMTASKKTTKAPAAAAAADSSGGDAKKDDSKKSDEAK
jgi:Spy/CpxP family protein refolding chaperone